MNNQDREQKPAQEHEQPNQGRKVTMQQAQEKNEYEHQKNGCLQGMIHQHQRQHA